MIADLREAVAAAEVGVLRNEDELFAFRQVPEAYGKLERGGLRGRAVVATEG